MHVQPEQILLGRPNTIYGLLNQLLGFDKKICRENQAEKLHESQQHNVAYHYIPMDNNGILVDELEKSEADVVHISPSHHFPYWNRYPDKPPLRWYGLGRRLYRPLFVEDDYDSEFA